MRFAPPNPLRILDRASGLNAPSVRSYNERLVLSLLLQTDGISRLEIGTKTGLSAQTVSVLVRSLEQEGLVAKGEAVRGRVGPPTIPLHLNPAGAFAVGVSFGAEALDVALVDFVGRIRHHVSERYSAIGSAAEPLRPLIERALAAVPAGCESRLAGIGLAVPNDTAAGGHVEHILGRDLTAAQRGLELELQQPVFMQNDVTAAASGETLFGAARSLRDLIFYYLGSDLHSRLVLNHQIFTGRPGTAFNTGLRDLRDRTGVQDLASLQIGRELLADRAYLAWRRVLKDGISEAVHSLLNFVHVGSLIIATYAPVFVGEAITADLKEAFPDMTIILARSPAPKAVGAASLPYQSRFMVQ